MSEPTYRQTFIHSWQMVWRNKSLWGLGLLSALFAGSFGINNFLGQLANSISNNGQVVVFSLPNFNFLPLDISQSYFTLTILGMVMLAVLIVVIYISVISKTSLLIAMADYYQTKKCPALVKIWNQSLPHFWKIFTLELGRKIAYFIILFIFGLIWVNTDSLQSGFGIIVSSLLLVVVILAALIVSSITVFASGYTIIDNRNLKIALQNGFKLFKKHFLVCLEVSILLLFIDFLLVAIIIAMLSVFFLPTALFSLIAVTAGSPLIAAIGVILSLVLTIVAVILIGAVYNTFYSAAWMYLFMEMHHNSILSHFRNFFKRLFS